MSDAGTAVREALMARLKAQGALVGVALFDGVAAAGVLPRVDIAEPQGVDWSAKDFRGRELRTAVTVRVADGQRGRIAALAQAAERAGEDLSGDIGGWRVAGALFLRSRGVTEKSVHAVLVEHRVRVIEI